MSLTVFQINVSMSNGTGQKTIFAKKLILAPGAYVNLNPWLKVIHLFIAICIRSFT